MAIYLIRPKTESELKPRLIDSRNPAQALAHVSRELFTIDVCGASEVAEAIIGLGINKVEKAGNGNE